MPGDQWFPTAQSVQTTGLVFITSSLVINEVVTFLQRRGHHSAALEFLAKIRLSSEVQIVYPDLDLQSAAWDLFNLWGSSGASAVDCVSFAIMNRAGIRKAFTFDQHFRKAGFEILGA